MYILLISFEAVILNIIVVKLVKTKIKTGKNKNKSCAELTLFLIALLVIIALYIFLKDKCAQSWVSGGR